MKKPVAIMIFDGWGISKNSEGNAVEKADTPNFDSYLDKYPSTKLFASGLNVGLPDGQMGNSEVGHLNIGAGRVVYQELTRITKSINDGDFFQVSEFYDALKNAREKNSDIHLMGLLSDGGVHSHIEHLKGLIDFFKKNDFDRLYLHMFMDGRDTSPRNGIEYVKEIKGYIETVGIGQIASISGRYYAMDRDKRWDRVEKAYNALVYGKGEKADDPVEAMKKYYNEDITDEFIIPTVIVENTEPSGLIKENDSIIFFNFRPDRARELTRAIVDVDFSGFERKYFETEFITMTSYDTTIKNVKVAYKPQKIKNTLGEILSKHNLKQLRIAETEKYAHVTFFFNGGVEVPSEGEKRILINSPKVPTYDMKPEMSAYEVTDALIKELDKNEDDVIILNYANPDMVGHTGVMEAAIKAVETVDICAKKVVDKILDMGGAVIITADHGNAEKMMDYETNTPMTAHTTNQVPCIVLGLGDVKLVEDGKLSDLAPTVLDIINIEKPVEMTGKSLIKK